LCDYQVFNAAKINMKIKKAHERDFSGMNLQYSTTMINVILSSD